MKIEAKNLIKIYGDCQILEANITKEGWEYLIGKFGMNGLYEADMRSEWFGCDGIEEFAEAVAGEMGAKR